MNLPIHIDSRDNTCLYMQIYSGIRQLITDNKLHPGTRLPGKRTLAEDLLVSVNTVNSAYQMLCAEGYVTAKEKSGFYVCKIGAPKAPDKSQTKDVEAPVKTSRYRYDFHSDGVDSSLFPFSTYRRIWRECSLNYMSFWDRGDKQGELPLRQAICDYLSLYRGVGCTPENIVVGAGSEYLLGLLAKLFRGRTLAVEDPCYPAAAKVFENEGLQRVHIPVGASGIDVGALQKSGADICYVTPNHQFPTGITMPVAAKNALLGWAGQTHYIIEDDHDSEFRYDTRPIPALQGQDRGDRVIYVSTFSRSIAPAVRVAYMVLPPPLMQAYNRMFSGYACTVSRLEQQALCQFLKDGHFLRHLNRQRVAYKERRDLLLAALKQVFKSDICPLSSHTGLYICVQFLRKSSESDLVSAARKRGIYVRSLGEFYRGTPPPGTPPTLVLGFASLSPQEILPAVDALAKAVNDTP